MSRFRLLAALTTVIALALSCAAVAQATKITGGTATLTLSTAASNVMTANHLTATPIAPATASGSTFTFPIARGRVYPHLHGFVSTRGGVALSNGTRTVRVRRLTVTATRAGIWVYALVPGLARHRCDFGTLRRRIRCRLSLRAHVARIAHVTGASVASATATGTVRLTPASARVINVLSGKQVARAGTPIGTGTVTVTVG